MNFSEAVERYGKAAKSRLSGPGQREALLVTPIAQFIEDAGLSLGLHVVPHDEVSEQAGAVRPDFAVRVQGAITGHIELKAPGTSLDPETYGRTTHNYKQWQRLKELPNLLHTNGTEFRLWRYGELVDTPVAVHAGDLATFRGVLTAPARMELVLGTFLQWTPVPITSVQKLVETLAPLARLLREEVRDALSQERRSTRGLSNPEVTPFRGIAKDWQRLLFPQATDEEFADGFAQTVVFALLLALSDGIELGQSPIREVAKKLEGHHTLMGKALNLLTEHVENTPTWTAIEVIVRVLSVADWPRLRGSGDRLYLHLYEEFLASYDPEKRRKSGSYYTPVQVVDAMVRITDIALREHLGKSGGLRNPNVSIVDPAMGTGTFPLSVLRYVASQAAAEFGKGAGPEAVSNAVARLYGLELQSGPFSVAELRISSTIQDLGADVPSNGLNLFVADTLEDPESAGDGQLSYTAQLIAQQRQRANKMKREQNVQVVIGNPPYKDHAGGLGGWIESGVDASTGTAPIDAFKQAGNGRHERHLSNLYAYFWRWATWKVFESTREDGRADSDSGAICFITASGYLAGPGFRGMREYLRRNCSHGWIINVSPEGKQPPSGSAVFNIETPVVIALFIRAEGTSASTPAHVRYRDIGGSRESKFEQLASLDLEGEGWRDVRADWSAPFTPSASTQWDEYPAVDDLIPWRANGIMAGRGWIYSPSSEVLESRLHDVISEGDVGLKSEKFSEGRDASLRKTKAPLAGSDTESETFRRFLDVTMSTRSSIVKCGFRVLDRQYVIADSRLMSQPSPSLWQGRVDGQVFAYELHSEYPKSGPGVAYSSLIPDVHFFRGSGGGRALPRLHPDGTPNIAPGLADSISSILGVSVDPLDVFDYVAGVAGDQAFVSDFDDELHTPGVRIPLTADADLWSRAVRHGRHLQWLQTFGESGSHPDGFTSLRDPRIAVAHPSYDMSVGSGIPNSWTYDELTGVLSVGNGRWSGVTSQARNYTVGGARVLDSWLNYRMAVPKKRKGSPLDQINSEKWDLEWSEELTRLLSILVQLIQLDSEISELRGSILSGELITRQALGQLGTEWPSGPASRRPRTSSEGTLGF